MDMHVPTPLTWSHFECSLQALGNMSSFIPRKQKPDLLGHAVETGVWGSLVDVLASEEDLQVQVGSPVIHPASHSDAFVAKIISL